MLDVVMVTVLHVNHKKNIAPLVRVNLVTAVDVNQVISCKVVIAMVSYLTVVWINIHVFHHFVLLLVKIFSKATKNFSTSWIDSGRGMNL